ncbi:uncharacterized protein M6B38_387515 [Iris pallida]|uniref:Uncharacterized protein n=1 Tax=Iris pallida TaxID=29817 RepID=A0AAX6G3B6_IRIPA|nr:uncharacterized protein M6B38_387515 [Iris pallida]
MWPWPSAPRGRWWRSSGTHEEVWAVHPDGEHGGHLRSLPAHSRAAQEPHHCYPHHRCGGGRWLPSLSGPQCHGWHLRILLQLWILSYLTSSLMSFCLCLSSFFYVVLFSYSFLGNW